MHVEDRLFVEVVRQAELFVLPEPLGPDATVIWPIGMLTSTRERYPRISTFLTCTMSTVGALPGRDRPYNGWCWEQDQKKGGWGP